MKTNSSSILQDWLSFKGQHEINRSFLAKLSSFINKKRINYLFFELFQLVDSADIAPLGSAATAGELILAPTGYTRDLKTFESRKEKLLASPELNAAPAHCFKPQPAKPDKNYFEVGQKLEAIDKKNASMICVATVAKVDGE